MTRRSAQTAAPPVVPQALPSPRAHPRWGHLGRWGTEPLELLAEGAQLGALFELRLPRRPVIVGWSPAWNRFVLRDTDTFRSRRSLSSAVPHLSGGIITTDAPAHRPRRERLDPPFRDVEGLRQQVRAAIEPQVPVGPFDGLDWSIEAVKVMLNAALFTGTFPPALLDRYLRPLEQGMPSALIPRVASRRAVRRELGDQLAHRERRGGRDLAAALVSVPNAVEELRVGLAAGFDTTAHTLAWCLWYLAAHPGWQPRERRRAAVDEVLRLHPAGFVSSRRAAATVTFEGRAIPRGTMVLTSPLLTHHDPDLWEDPGRFDPTRFDDGIRAWSYLPFSAGSRTCLGAHLARLMLDEAIDAVLQRPLCALAGDPTPRAAVTIAPKGPLQLLRGIAPTPTPTGTQVQAETGERS